MPLFKLTLKTIIARNTYLVFLLLLVLLPWILPYLTPFEEKPSVFAPARAQTAWSMLWVISLVWLIYQAAIMGHDGASQGVLEYFKTLGMKKRSQMLQLWANSLLFCGICLSVVLFTSLVFALPEKVEGVRPWVATNLQFALLYCMVMPPLFLLAIALGTRVNGTAAYVVTAGLAVYGLYGIGYLDFFLSQSGNPVIDSLYVISPHYHLADLTNRLVFQMGPLETGAFIKILVYFVGFDLLVVAVSAFLFQVKK
ncbi:MAG: hypothetical protein L3J39_17255 [Verrucomicrobiales bacterium]|nr:hypothetical protein [Verrucomicrobiales bacterium]